MLAVLANWKRILYGTALALLGTLLLVQTARIEGALFWKGLKAENTELRETLAKVEQAQKLATKLAKEEKARIEAENERKAENAKADYQKRLADNRAAIDRWLRSQAGSATGNADLPETGQATGKPSGTSGASNISTDYALVPVSDLSLAAEAFAKLTALQAWARDVSDPEKPDRQSSE
jgi:hypothetical protein